MMKSFVVSAVLLFITTLAFSQSEDTVAYADEYDTTQYDDEYYEYESDTAYSNSTYTKNPGDLTATQKDRDQSYNGKKFSKTEWKKIVGETNYTEDPIEEEPKEKEQQKTYRPPSEAWNPALLKILGYVAIILLIGTVIYFLLKSTMLNEPVAQKIGTGDPLLRANQHIDEITESDIDRLLREALERNDFRAAIRLYYIRLLKHLHSGGYIAWKKNKTNRDYATELSASSFVREFRKLMIAYEIIWYGERTPSAEEFKKLQGNFIEIQNQSARAI